MFSRHLVRTILPKEFLKLPFAKLLALLASTLSRLDAEISSPQYGVLHTSLIFYNLYLYLAQSTLLAEVFILSLLFPSLFMAAFTAAVFFPGDNLHTKVTGVLVGIFFFFQRNP